MSFLLSPSTSEGYCDWRISLEEDCRNRHIYRGFVIAGAACYFLSFLLGSFALTFRKLVLKDQWRSFGHGANLSLLFFTLAPLVSGPQFLLVLTGANRLASAILWGLMTPMTLLSNLVYFSTLVKLLPSSVMLTSSSIKSQWLPTDGQRKSILFSLYLTFFFSHSIFMPLAEWEHSQGRSTLSSILLRAGLSITAISIAIYSSIYYFVAVSLIRRMEILLEDATSAKSDGSTSDAGLMGLIVTKLKNNLVFCVFGGIQYPVFFLPLAYYPEFFADQTCSMAYAFVVTVFFPFSALPLFFAFILADFKKAFVILPQKSRGNTSEASKRDEKRSLGMKSLNDSRQNVEKIIEDLNNSTTNS